MPRQVFRSGPFSHVFAQAVRIGDAIHLAGQVAVDESGELVGHGDLVAQVSQVYANAAAALAGVGADLGAVAAETWFVTDMADFLAKGRAIGAIRRNAYGEDPPVAQTVVQVAGLYRPEALVEVQFVGRV